ncbi:hypothetical protein KP509_16G028600 [Ceratopteris richardii]|uniref:Glycosyltransferase n=1 Tax=Ceratopteris richardii TaxID=49495 RepID=A0A8T2T0M8_CERRI|nr:hypothetical protein KP509_16G028600 [Ceratopteris richardii]
MTSANERVSVADMERDTPQQVLTKSVWILPCPLQGHINPLLQLARALAGRGVHVVFLVPKATLPERSSLETPGLSVLALDDGLPPDRSRGSNIKDSFDSMNHMESAFVRLLDASRQGVACLIYDAFVAWAPKIASSLSIRSSCFFTSNATACAVVCHIPVLIDRGILPFRSDENAPLPTSEIQGIDGAPDLLPEEFPVCITFDATHFRYKFMAQLAKTLRNASSIIINTVEELEQEPIAALRASVPIYTVGPLLLLSGRPSRLAVNFWPEDDECLQWLDSQTPSSVLFVSFGSMASPSLHQFQELAMGLEASGQRFLWVVRPDSTEVPLQDALPVGFLERTKDRGFIISWGPQLLILSHRSIGGFLTHGGWNSITENLSTGNVPMVCWPHEAEQRLNRRLMCDMWNIGLRLQQKEDGIVAKEEIVRVISRLFHGNEARELKEASTHVVQLVTKAIAKGGSSSRNLQDFQRNFISV